jgi:dienelactone hydrolase
MSILDTLLIVTALAAALWWAVSRHRRPAVLEAFSFAASSLAVLTLALEDTRWQLVPLQVLAVAVAAAAALRRWRPGRSRRWRRVIARSLLFAGLAAAGVALLTSFVPALPEPSGPHQVGSEIFRWTDGQRPETLTANPSDHRQVIAQAWYPSNASKGRSVPYFEAQDHLPGAIGGMPSFMFGSFGGVATHATFGPPISAARKTWPVLLFSPGLSLPREMYTALCADLASRGYVVVALSEPYESAVSVLAGGRVVGQTTHPDVMGPPPHPALERLIDIRAADSSFALDQLSRLAQLDPNSPLAGHLDLEHVGIAGHSIGGATAVQVMAGDRRFKVGVNLDGKLFGREPEARLDRPFLWIQSGDAKTAEYTQGRDKLLHDLRDGGSLLTVRGSTHVSFTDSPSYLTSLGRRLAGGATVGSISIAAMTAMTGDTIAAFVGPALGVKGGRSLNAVLAADPGIRLERRIAAKAATAASPAAISFRVGAIHHVSAVPRVTGRAQPVVPVSYPRGVARLPNEQRSAWVRPITKRISAVQACSFLAIAEGRPARRARGGCPPAPL